jgi:hemerythrin
MTKHIEWEDKLSVSVEAMDEEHKVLLRIINQLYDAIENKDGRRVLGDIFTSLEKYTAFHFSNEEELMERMGYPGLEGHKAAHRKLVQELADLKHRDERGDSVGVAAETMDFLKDWLVGHIQGVDKQYGAFASNAQGD